MKTGRFAIGLFAALLGLPGGAAAEGAADNFQEITTPAVLGQHDAVSFYYRMPVASAPPAGLLLLVPGYNGSGHEFLRASASWYPLADAAKLVLVSPTFHSTQEEIHSRRGYYYPGLWSGAATIEAVDRIASKTGVSSNQLLIFGFSAGAHFAHRFALWNPGRVKAFVAYSAGWWDAPTDRLKGVPALIMCGERDERYQATYDFFEKGLALGLPWIWRSYSGTGHQITPSVTRMAQAFLDFYASNKAPEHWIGDAQTYRFYPADADEVQFIPPEAAIRLPSKTMANIWSHGD